MKGLSDSSEPVAAGLRPWVHVLVVNLLPVAV